VSRANNKSISAHAIDTYEMMPIWQMDPVLYTELYISSAINSQRLVVHYRPHLPRLPCHRQVLSTPDCPLSLFILHSPTVSMIL